MTSQAYLPDINQVALQSFQSNFLSLAQQKNTLLGSSPAVMYMPSSGKTHNIARGGRMELTEVEARNPDKQFSDWNPDNRQFRKRRFTTTVTIDALYDINELIADPTSFIVEQLNNAKNREIDRVIVQAAVGNVVVGSPDSSGSVRTAAQDGVLTVDAASGLTYAKITEITENFISYELPMDEFRGTVLAVSGKENSDLMQEEEFISSDYISSRPVEQGYQSNAGMYSVALFGGSRTGGIQVANPILPEGTTLRKCVALAPNSIAVAMELSRLEVERSASKVNSYDITIDLWLNAMRIEGSRVQLISTTI
jgi:hypothetical protein